MKPLGPDLTLAAVQMNSGDRLENNLASAAQLIQMAAEGGADIVVLPENFSLMPTTTAQRHQAAARAGEVQEFLSSSARDSGVCLVAGSTPFPAADGRVTNTCLAFNRTGSLLGRYDKIHLFDVNVAPGESYQESSYIMPGSEPVNVTVAGVTIGLTICYDLRFPELYRALGAQGAEMFTVPSAFTVATGTAHWHSLLRARAIENLAWVIAPAQVGSHPGGRATFGHSLIIDPWGEVLAEAASEPGVIVAPMERAKGARRRRTFPVLRHRRL